MTTFSSDVTAGTDVQIGHLNNLRKDLLLGARISESPTVSSIVTLDFSDVTKGNIKTINLDQNITLRFSGITKYPTIFFVRLVQDSTGGRVVTIDQSGVRYPGGVAPVISTGSNRVTGLMFICNGVNDFDCYYAGFELVVPS